MKSFFPNFLLSIILGTLILFVFCSRDEPSRDIVAEVGKEKISRDEFDISFALNPQYAIRTPMRKARQSQINFLVNEKYYYLASRKVDLAKDSVVQSRLAYIRDQEIIKAYLHKNFIDKVSIDDEKLLQAHSRLGLKVHVQHLFAETREAADSLWRLHSQGETFESLAKEIYRDSVLSETGGDLGFIGFGDMDPRLEDQVYAMKPGEVSRPVQSAYGYHILKVLEFQQNEQFLETPEPVKIKTLREILQTRAADQRIREHLKELAGERQIRISNRVLDMLVGETRQVMGDRYEEVSPFKPSIYTGDLNRIELQLADLLDEDLARFGEEEIRVGDFLERLKQMPPLHRPYLRTRARMSQALIDMIRNDLILQEALSGGIQNDATVKAAIEKYSEELLAGEFQKRLYSDSFKDNYPEDWREYSQVYEKIKTSTRTEIYQERLFSDLPAADTVMAPEPIRLFLKNRYTW